MANMSYCRFRNTRDDLRDCLENLNDPDMSPEEIEAKADLLELCQSILESSGYEVTTPKQLARRSDLE